MFTLNENNEYEAEINGVKFVCESVEDDYEETAAKIAEVYESKLDDIAQFMINEGISDFYGEFMPQEIINSLGKPTVDLERCLVSYYEHTLDDVHIIEFEYDGLLDELFYLNIDGWTSNVISIMQGKTAWIMVFSQVANRWYRIL